MTKIWAIFDGEPHMPPSAQSPTAKRKTWASPTSGKIYAVDYVGDAPTDEQIRRFVEPTGAEMDATEKAGEKLALRGPQMRAVRVALRVLVKKIPCYSWQQFLAEFDTAMDAESANQ